VRLVRDDGQRQGALDLPHPRGQGGDADGTLEIAPLANLPVIKDLATDMTEFFDKWARAKGQFQGAQTRHDDFARVSPASPERQAANAGIECIGCGVCYASCDVVSWRPDFLGPAALNRAWTLVNDVRDTGRTERLRAVAGDAGCHSLPHAGLVHRALPQGHRADDRHRRAQAQGGARGGAGRAVSARRRGPATTAAPAPSPRRAAGTGSASAPWCWRCACWSTWRHGVGRARRPERRRDPGPHAGQLAASPLFYAVFVLACAVHVPMGLVNIAASGGAGAAPPRLPGSRALVTALLWCWACARCGRLCARGA
jgi:ferredoxin